MKLKVCEYCGTEYDEAMDCCPLCGKGSEHGEKVSRAAARRPAKKGGARVAKKSRRRGQNRQERIPQWMWAVSCVILGIAVLVGLVYFLISMEYLGGKKEETQQPSSELQIEPEQPEVLPEEEEEPEAADLSCRELTLNQIWIVFDEQGSSVFLTAVPTPVDCDEPIVFTSLDEKVVTVDQNGMLTAVSDGQTQVIATCGDVTAECTVVCDFVYEEEEPEPTEPEEPGPEEEEEPEEALPVELSSTDFTLFRPGEEAALTVKNAPEGAVITYASSDSSVATVSSNGTVKAVGNGMATITVTVGSEKLTCIARCNLGTTAENTDGAGESGITGTLSLTYEDVSLFSEGESFTIRLQDSQGNRASGVSWSTSNSGVCAVDASGVVTAMGGGTATVTATYGGKSYSCIVRCNF